MPEAPSSLDRRTFCACALTVTAVACGGGGGGSAATGGTITPPPPPGLKTTTDTKASLLATPAGTVRDYRDLGAFWLIHDATGIYAITAICTHMGCTVGQAGASFACPCHGSQFDLNGGNTVGPATSPLVHFAVTEPTPGAALVVNTGSTVVATTRLT